MRKKLYLAALTAALSLGTAATAYAAQWVPDSSGWWYQEDGGSWPASTWSSPAWAASIFCVIVIPMIVCLLLFFVLKSILS